MFVEQINRILRVTKRDPEIWPTMTITFAVIIYGADVALRKLKGDPNIPGPFESAIAASKVKSS